jgi:homogentisate phytyltransferase/homogentisate geranylgeranyltransferase
MKMLTALYKFSRPHTIAGTVISIVTLYMMLCSGQRMLHIPSLIMALVCGISINIFIVGLNQVADVEIDRINKPWLPIPAGLLNVRQAGIIAYSALVISLSLSLYMTPYFFLLIALSALTGWAYSMPPFYLKQHHLPAAIAISLVRGIVINAGGFLVFTKVVNSSEIMPVNLKILILFITLFGIVIAWFKDLADMKGDARHGIKTLAIVHSPRATLIAGNILLGAAYLFTIYLKYNEYHFSGIASGETKTLFYGHIILLVLFILNSFSIRFESSTSVQRFYKRFWWFFFAEYIIYLLAYI